jgi:uncharacterized membrane protein YkoI
MKQNRSWVLIVGLLGLTGTHCSTEPSDASPSTSTADAVAHYEQALAGAEVSLAQAIANAAAKYPEATLEDARFDAEAASPVFEIDLLVGDTVLEARVDPATGEVQSWGPDDDADEETEAGEAPEGDETCDRAGRVPRDQAIESAEAAAGGRAVEMEDDGCCFGVRVYGDGEFRDVDVDAHGNVGDVRHVAWGGRKGGPRPGHGRGDGAAGADGAGPGGPWQGQGGDGDGGPRGGGSGGDRGGPFQGQGGGGHDFPGGDAGSNG